MTTPHQGPGMWRQGDREGALDWLASLDANEQRDLQRVMSAMGTARPMLDRMARARDFSEQQYARAGAFVSQKVTAGQEQLNRATTYGQEQLNRANTYRQEQVTRATAYGQLQMNRATEFGGRQLDRVGDGLSALRDKAKETKDRVVSGASRWWDKRRGASTTRSAMVQSAFHAPRQDPDVLRTIQQTGTTPKELKQLNELSARAMFHPDAETRLQAQAELVQAWAQQDGHSQAQQSPQQNEQSTGKHPTGPGDQTLTAWVNQGQPSAAQATIQQKQTVQGQGEAPTTGGHGTQRQQGTEQGK